jgi:hypothetical protein
MAMATEVLMMASKAILVALREAMMISPVSRVPVWDMHAHPIARCRLASLDSYLLY